MRVLFLSLLGLAVTGTLHGQASGYVAADAVFSSRYMWRGLTRASSLVIQPDVYFSLAGPTVSPLGLTIRYPNLTAGGWANYEIGSPDSDEIGQLGTGEKGFGEVNGWIQLAGSLGRVTLSTGWIRYAFRGEATRPDALSSLDDTQEIFARMELDFRSASLAVSWWNDVDRVDGVYWETGFNLRLPLQPIPFPQVPLDPAFAILDLGILAGWNASQTLDAGGGGGHFADEGLTHVQFTASSSVLIGRQLSIEPRLHLQINSDDQTRIVSRDVLDPERGAVWWFSITVSLLDILGNGIR